MRERDLAWKILMTMDPTATVGQARYAASEAITQARLKEPLR